MMDTNQIEDTDCILMHEHHSLMPHVQFGELPSYVAYMLGFSYEDRSMYFVDTSGAKIASKVTITMLCAVAHLTNLQQYCYC